MYRTIFAHDFGLRATAAVALALAAAAVIGLTIGPNLVVSSTRLPALVRLSPTPSTNTPITSLPTTRPAPTQPREPVETVSPQGTVVTLPSPDGQGGDQQSSSDCSSGQTCSSSGG